MAASCHTLLELPVVAADAITQYRGVGFDGNQASTQGQAIMGIAMTDQVSGQSLSLAVAGTAIVEAGAAIDVGDPLIVDNEGRAITASALAIANSTIPAGATAVTSTAANGAIVTPGAFSGGVLPSYVFGYAIDAAAGAGDLIEVLLRK